MTYLFGFIINSFITSKCLEWIKLTYKNIISKFTIDEFDLLHYAYSVKGSKCHMHFHPLPVNVAVLDLVIVTYQ